LPRKDGPDGERDLRGGQCRHRHLIEQGLKEVVVRAIHEQHVDALAFEAPRHGDAAETRAHDDDALPPAHDVAS